MRKAFTLIELMVVTIIMVVVMGLVIPKGAKMLSSFETNLKKTKSLQELSKERSFAFLQAEEKTYKTDQKVYTISPKGVISQNEKSDDND